VAARNYQTIRYGTMNWVTPATIFQPLSGLAYGVWRNSGNFDFRQPIWVAQLRQIGLFIEANAGSPGCAVGIARASIGDLSQCYLHDQVLLIAVKEFVSVLG
jgi:hypothetical protein